jgi:predicted porin
MKKALIAAAVAGAFVAPSAMAAELNTSVYWSTAITTGENTTTLAGVDTSADVQDVRDGGGNRLMFTWTDTLDNGIGVTAYMSFGNLDTASAGGVSLRNSNIGFSGDFGTIQVGTNEHFSETDLLFDPSWGDFGNTGDAISHINVGQTGFNFTRRDGESVWYTSNNMNGFDLRAVYIMGPQSATAAADQDGSQIGIRYRSGPLSVGVNQAVYNDYAANGGGAAADTPIAGSEASMTTFLASYDMGSVMIKAAMWTITQDGLTVNDNLGNATTAFEVEGRSIFVGMPMGGGTLWAQSSSMGDQDATQAGVTSAIVDSGRDGWDVGYHHPMNANVNFFLRYGESETGINFNDTATKSAAADSSQEISELMLGWQLMY